MKRFHLFEIEDQPWLPTALRDGLTDYLRFSLQTFRLYSPVVPMLSKALERTNSTSIVDLCSGGGGGIVGVGEGLDWRYPITLTDRYPNLSAFESLHRTHPSIGFEAKPVDARDVPSRLEGFRTLFTSFHHFTPDEADAILRDAVDKKVGIAVFEAGSRTVEMMVRVAIAALALPLFTPFIRPFRWSRLFLTYLIPLIPLGVLWDGWVSCLRFYTPEELKRMGSRAGGSYVWESGEIRGPSGNPLTYLIGVSSDG